MCCCLPCVLRSLNRLNVSPCQFDFCGVFFCWLTGLRVADLIGADRWVTESWSFCFCHCPTAVLFIHTRFKQLHTCTRTHTHAHMHTTSMNDTVTHNRSCIFRVLRGRCSDLLNLHGRFYCERIYLQLTYLFFSFAGGLLSWGDTAVSLLIFHSFLFSDRYLFCLSYPKLPSLPRNTPLSCSMCRWMAAGLFVTHSVKHTHTQTRHTYTHPHTGKCDLSNVQSAGYPPWTRGVEKQVGAGSRMLAWCFYGEQYRGEKSISYQFLQ